MKCICLKAECSGKRAELFREYRILYGEELRCVCVSFSGLLLCGTVNGGTQKLTPESRVLPEKLTVA
jgi:hypothetical protein